MNSSTTCETHLTVGCNAHREESTFNKRALHRDDDGAARRQRTNIPCKVLEMYRAGPRYILQSDFITSLDLHHESKVTIPPSPLAASLSEFDRASICARCISACLPAYLDDSISS